MNIILSLLAASCFAASNLPAPNLADYQLQPEKTAQALSTGDVAARRAAIHQFVSSLDTSLVKDYDNSLLPVLLRATKDSDPEVRYYGLSAARMLAQAIILSKQAKDGRVFGRKVSIRFEKEPNLLPVFQKAAIDSDIKIRICAVAVLGKAYPPSPDSEKTLVNLAKSETNAKVKREIVDGLGAGRYQSDDAVQTLITMLDEHSAEVKGWAGFFLGQIRAKGALPRLIAGLDDDRPFVRERISEGIGAFGADARPFLPELRRKLATAKEEQGKKALQSAIETVEGSK